VNGLEYNGVVELGVADRNKGLSMANEDDGMKAIPQRIGPDPNHADGNVPSTDGQSSLPALTDEEYKKAHGEELKNTLDLDTWIPGTDLAAMYTRLEQEVAAAVVQEREFQRRIRETIFPMLRGRKDAPPCAGVWHVRVDQLEDVHRKLLFNGAVEACDGTVVSHDTLPVTITQIGVCLVSYRGDQGSWVHRIFRRDLRTSNTTDPVDETMELLERRTKRSAPDQSSKRDRLSDLARRGIMDYAERAVLMKRSTALWRMGHGSPTPHNLMTGSGMPELLASSLELMREIIEGHKRFVFVQSSTSERWLLTIGNALPSLHYAIVDTNKPTLERIIASGGYRGEWGGKLLESLHAFAEDCGRQVVIGIYRASELAPAQIFFAHREHAHEAAIIAMADSALQEHRGFPMLIDLADKMCTASFGGDVFAASAQLAYAAAGEPFRYMTERSTRGR
jgi:hypothetical protein